MGVPQYLDDLEWKILLERMIWGHPNDFGNHHIPIARTRRPRSRRRQQVAKTREKG